jgi:hypothetical protein
MFEWIASGVANAVVGVFGSAILQPILSAWAKSRDVNLEELRARLGVERDEATALLAHEGQRIAAQASDRQAMMSHRVWWIAWALFVLPVGLYHAAIYAVSILDAPIVIRRVPATQEAWGQLVVLSMFGLYATTGIVDAVLARLAKK